MKTKTWILAAIAVGAAMAFVPFIPNASGGDGDTGKAASGQKAATTPAIYQGPNGSQWAGLKSEEINGCYAEQEKSQWCWAASIQMVMGYYGVKIKQEDIVKRSYGSNPFGRLPDWPASYELVTQNLNNWGIDRDGKKYTVVAAVWPGVLTPSLIVSELANRRPLIIGYAGHASIITAVEYFGTAEAPFITRVVVRDPWPSPQSKLNNGRIEYPAILLASNIAATWIVRVQVQEKK